LRQLSRRYRVKLTYSYEEYEDCLRSGKVDAVYIALPNNMHAEYSVRAANAGVHVKSQWPSPIRKRPTLKQEKHRPPVAKPKLIHVESASV